MIIPYRVKNPPRSFPSCTVALIVLNTLVFAATSQSFLVIKGSVVQSYALNWGATPAYTILTAMFLHADIFHLLGNVLFLWVFGPAVEDRLRIPGYLGLYLLTGFAGSVAHATLGAVGGCVVPTLGASGCIMGVLGAYWYLFPWSKVCLAYFFMFLIKVWYGVVEVAAVWVIGAYFALDLFWGCFYKAAGGGGSVANFAHVGGAFTGALLLWMLNAKRDSEKVSMARATHADLKSIDLLSPPELKELVAADPEDEELLVKYADKALDSESSADIRYALTINSRVVVTRCPRVVVHYLVVMCQPPDCLSATDLLYLGRWCEQTGTAEQALRIYGMVANLHSESPELEIALMRLASVLWTFRKDGPQALAYLNALLDKFPRGVSVFEAEDLRDSIMQAAETSQPRAA